VGARTKARKRALDVLYAADVQGVHVRTLLDVAMVNGEVPADYTRTLLEGVASRRDEIDDIIERYSTGWSIDRMPAVDRNLLRVAVFEVLSGQVDAPVAVSEAVALAKRMSTNESPGFINGVMGSLIKSEPAFREINLVPIDEVALDADLDELDDEPWEFGEHFGGSVAAPVEVAADEATVVTVPAEATDELGPDDHDL